MALDPRELSRFRSVRAPQRKNVGNSVYVAPINLEEAAPAIDITTPVLARVDQFHAWLLARDFGPNPADVQEQVRAVLGDDPEAYAAARRHVTIDIESAIRELQNRPIQDGVLASGMMAANRLLVFGFVDAFDADAAAFPTGQSIADWFRNTHLVIGGTAGALLARRPGFADLYVIREEWNRYEAAEIADIENVMPTESRSHDVIQLNEVKTDVATTTTSEKTTQTEIQTTDRSSLQVSTSQDVQTNIHAEGQVDTQSDFGPTQVTTHLGGSIDSSTHDSTSRAVTTARESVSRAVNKVSQIVTISRRTTTTARTTVLNKHRFDNSGGMQPITGIYRWVNEVRRVQTVRYPHRFLLEFEIPQPAAWYNWTIAQAPPSFTPPTPFTLTGKAVDLNNPTLRASDLTPDNYLEISARYASAGLDPPPPEQVTVAKSLKQDAGPPDPPLHYENDTFDVPDGYFLADWSATYASRFDFRRDGDQYGFLCVTVGGDVPVSFPVDLRGDPPQRGWPGDDPYLLLIYGAFPYPAVGTMSGTPYDPMAGRPRPQGSVPVSVQIGNLWGYTLNLQARCLRLDGTLAAWQVKTYDVIRSGYQAMQDDYARAVENERLTQAGSIPSPGRNPAENAEFVRNELKRQVMELLTRQINGAFAGRPGLFLDPNTLEPDIGDAAVASAAEIQFLEQAFEWENLTYIMYPYFWTDRGRWPGIAFQRAGADDYDFDRFLRAGSARVIVPARPLYWEQVNLYTATGIIWGGGPVPAPNDPDYLSIAQEIKDQQLHPTDGVPCDAWEVRIPTELIWLDGGSPLPVNPDPTIVLP